MTAGLIAAPAILGGPRIAKEDDEIMTTQAPPPAPPPQPAAPITVTLANKVRLWFAAGCQALAIVLLLIMASSFHYYPVIGVTGAAGDALTLIGWALALTVAAATLASISMYRFVRPRQAPQQPVRPGPSATEPMESQQSAPARQASGSWVWSPKS